MTTHALHPGSADGGTHATSSLRPWALFDIPITPARPAELLATISDWAAQRVTRRVMHVNANVINRARRTPELAGALRRADLVYGEGRGLRLAARVLHASPPAPMTPTDWLWGLAAVSDLPGPSLYLLGSEPPVAQEAAERLRSSHPRFDVVGAHHGFFDLHSPHNERVIEDIIERQPQIVLVGMGTPKQELWVDRYADRLGGSVVWTVGALFDHVSGHIPPRRIGRRYLLENPEFAWSVLTKARRRGR